MSASEIIDQFKALPANERAQVAKFILENDDSWIPESFKQGMADAPMQKRDASSTWIRHSTSRIPAINEVSFPRNTRVLGRFRKAVR
jgi:hypothetical protein